MKTLPTTQNSIATEEKNSNLGASEDFYLTPSTPTATPASPPPAANLDLSHITELANSFANMFAHAFIEALTQAQFSMQTLHNMQNTQNLTNLAQAKNTPKFKPKSRANQSLTNTLYLPELDYLVWVTRMRDEFKKGYYLATGGMKMLPNTKNTNPKSTYGYEITGHQNIGHDIIIPSTALFRDVVAPYGVDFKHDYRINPRAQSFYMKGVMDAGNNNAPYRTNASCYIMNMFNTPQPPDAILDATEAYWLTLSPEEEAMRILSKDDMLRLIDRLREGASPDRLPWIVPGVDMENADNLRENTALLSPRRVTLAEGF